MASFRPQQTWSTLTDINTHLKISISIKTSQLAYWYLLPTRRLHRGIPVVALPCCTSIGTNLFLLSKLMIFNIASTIRCPAQQNVCISGGESSIEFNLQTLKRHIRHNGDSVKLLPRFLTSKCHNKIKLLGNVKTSQPTSWYISFGRSRVHRLRNHLKTDVFWQSSKDQNHIVHIIDRKLATTTTTATNSHNEGTKLITVFCVWRLPSLSLSSWSYEKFGLEKEMTMTRIDYRLKPYAPSRTDVTATDSVIARSLSHAKWFCEIHSNLLQASFQPHF